MKPIYDSIGKGYTGKRVPDPRIAAMIHGALGDAKTVLNVGAGTGSYEPTGRAVTALEPSTEMIKQRPEGAAQVVQGFSENIPFADGQFEAVMAVLTVHHWTDFEAGIREMQRVAAKRLVILTFDPAAPYFWLADYLPEIIALDQPIMPPIAKFAELLGDISVLPVPIPHDCSDGFLGAYWQRPHAYLDPDVRAAISTFAKLDTAPKALKALEADLKSGAWDAKYGNMHDLTELDIGYRLVVAELA